MSPISVIAEELVLSMLLGAKVRMPKISKAEFALMAISALLASAGILYLAVSLDRNLSGKYPPDMAALFTACLAFGAAFLSMALAFYLQRRKSAAFRASGDGLGKNIRSLIEDICRELDDPVKENPKMAMLLAAVAGFITANHHLKQ